MATLQALFEEQMADLPRIVATEIVRDKLANLGKADDEVLLKEVVGQLLREDGGDHDEGESDSSEIAPGNQVDLIVRFDEEDVKRVEQFTKDFSNELPEVIGRVADDAAKNMLRRYRRAWKAWRSHELETLAAFRRNLYGRWGKGFDSLWMLLDLCRDIGSEFHDRTKRSRSKRNRHLATALTCLHVRGCQISAEILTLMENGFADGAMARWRTLHEVSVVANVLADGGDLLAERYLLHEVVEAKRAMDEYAKRHRDLGYAPLAKRSVTDIERSYAAALARFGAKFREPFGWAAEYTGNPNPKFHHLEERIGRAVMRSHYKFASQNVHASPKGIAYRLGSMGEPFAIVAAATNVGFTEPGQNLSLSLVRLTMPLLPKRWTLDNIARWSAIMRLRDQIPALLAAADNRIKREERKKRRAGTGRATSGRSSNLERRKPSAL